MPHYKNRKEMMIDVVLTLLLLAVISELVYLGICGFFALGRMVLRAMGPRKAALEGRPRGLPAWCESTSYAGGFMRLPLDVFIGLGLEWLSKVFHRRIR